MIPISQIDPELSIYKENTVVIWGAGEIGTKIVNFFQNLKIDVACICDSNPQKWSQEIQGIPIISPQELQEMRREKQILLQFALRPQYEAEVKPLVEGMGLENTISSQEGFQMLGYYHKCTAYQQFPKLLEMHNNTPSMYNSMSEMNVFQHFRDNYHNLGIFLCMCPKTGDHTMMYTLSGSSVPHVQMHEPKLLNKNLYPDFKVKIITAIRDPIARDISSIYQSFSYFGEQHLSEHYYLEKTNDAQILFEYFSNATKKEKLLEKAYPTLNLEKINLFAYSAWFTSFKENIVDILAHPFDREKGYTIIKEGNYDIFFYQLERLNDLVPELSDWVGVPFTELVNGNEASTKWIANSYKQAQKELKFSQEYFDLCYNDPYVQHCYSPEDIEKFKDRWRKNIDPSK